MELIKDLPHGPLDYYREKASFNWKKMILFLESEETIKLTNEAYEFLENEPIFQHADHELTLEEERQITLLRMKKIYSSKIFYPDDYFFDQLKAHDLNSVLGLYDWSLLARKGLLKDFAVSGIFGLGTERHIKYISSIMNFEMGFAFCLTEISHGTNTKAMRTEARYDVGTESFIVHTPDFEAAKCWAGNLGKTASHCLVFAQLYTSDGICNGLHCFIVPVRDPRTLQPYPGVTIMDMGHKLGMNGIDNGVAIFDHVSIPRENLLNKTGDVSRDGKYVSPFKDPKKRFGASLGNLSVGRVSIIGFCVVNLRKCLTIAIRYSCVRKQFGPSPHNEEWPVIEYPLQQWRLFPYLAGLYALHVFSLRFKQHYVQFSKTVMSADTPDNMANFGQEIHALSCVGKPYSSWLARDAIQECREACGGHGYLKAAGFGHLRDDNDANCTYEGDNNVLLQQTSNWLLSVWARRNERSCVYPMGTADYLHDADHILRLEWNSSTFRSTLSDQDVVHRCLEAYEWLVCWLCKVTSGQLDRQLKLNKNNLFHARNNTQLFRAHTLALAYAERVVVHWFKDSIVTSEDASLRVPLWRLCSLFVLTRLLRHVAFFVEGGLLSSHSTIVTDMEEHVKRLLTAIVPDALALVDAFAPPDFLLRSVLGNADGKVYTHMYQAIISAKGALTRDTQWEKIRYVTPSKL